MAAIKMASSVLSAVPLGDGLAVKDDLSLDAAMVTLRKLDARDKATKIMQYGSRFFYWWFAKTDPALSEKAYKLFRTTQRSRKAFRMLKVLDEVVKFQQIFRDARKNAHSALDASSSSRGKKVFLISYTEALLSLRCLAMGCFWTFDNLNYLTLTDTVNFGVSRALKGFSRSWSVGSAVCILLGIEALRKTGKKRQDLSREYSDVIDRRRASSGDKDEGVSGTGGSGDGDAGGEGEEEEVRLREALRAANAEHFKSWLMIFKGVLDLTCAVNISGMDLPKRAFGRKLNDGVVGAAGCASALCVLYNSWPARKQQLSPSQSPQSRQSQLQSQERLLSRQQVPLMPSTALDGAPVQSVGPTGG